MKKIIATLILVFSTLNAEWIVQSSISPIDDSPTEVLILSEESKPDYLLVLKCQENTTDVYYKTGGFFDIVWGNKKVVISRIGKKKAIKSNWISSTDGQALFVRKPIRFIKELLNDKTNKLVLRVGNKTLFFNTTGLKEAINPLRKACGW